MVMFFKNFHKVHTILVALILVFVFAYSFIHFAHTGITTFNQRTHASEQNTHTTCLAFFDIQNKISCSQKNLLDLFVSFVLLGFAWTFATFFLYKKAGLKNTRVDIPSYLQILFSRGVLHRKIPS